MALLLTNNRYLKININGEYTIYESEENRNNIKNSVSVYSILNKYTEVIANLLQDIERRYYDPTFEIEIQKWVDEVALYKSCVYSGDTTKKFPLMKKYFKDINKTIPKIIAQGKLGIKANSLEEMYQKVKNLEIFGSIEEVKDI